MAADAAREPAAGGGDLGEAGQGEDTPPYHGVGFAAEAGFETLHYALVDVGNFKVGANRHDDCQRHDHAIKNVGHFRLSFEIDYTTDPLQVRVMPVP